MYADVIVTVLHSKVRYHGPRGIAVVHHVRKATIFDIGSPMLLLYKDLLTR